MEEEKEEIDLLSQLICIQADFISYCILVFLSPFLSLFSMATQSYHRVEKAEQKVESIIEKVISNMSSVVNGIMLGFVRAAYLCMFLFVIWILCGLVGVSLVNLCVEEPVCVRERLYFDYTYACPKAVSTLGLRLPIGHTISVSLFLLMPESEYNRDIGVFQLTAELLSLDEDVIAKSSQPCMLRFRSFPVRLTQKMMMQVLKYKQESSSRKRGVRVTLSPRAGTSSLPQIYEAEIIFHSHLPWQKEWVRKWKWTVYVWVSFYMYLLMLLLLLGCCKSFLFPVTVIPVLSPSPSSAHDEASIEEDTHPREESDELLRRWRESRRHRKPMSLYSMDDGT